MEEIKGNEPANIRAKQMIREEAIFLRYANFETIVLLSLGCRNSTIFYGLNSKNYIKSHPCINMFHLFKNSIDFRKLN